MDAMSYLPRPAQAATVPRAHADMRCMARFPGEIGDERRVERDGYVCLCVCMYMCTYIGRERDVERWLWPMERRDAYCAVLYVPRYVRTFIDYQSGK
jgi:hypothetical protein